MGSPTSEGPRVVLPCREHNVHWYVKSASLAVDTHSSFSRHPELHPAAPRYPYLLRCVSTTISTRHLGLRLGLTGSHRSGCGIHSGQPTVFVPNVQAYWRAGRKRLAMCQFGVDCCGSQARFSHERTVGVVSSSQFPLRAVVLGECSKSGCCDIR